MGTYYQGRARQEAEPEATGTYLCRALIVGTHPSSPEVTSEAKFEAAGLSFNQIVIQTNGNFFHDFDRLVSQFLTFSREFT